MHVSPGSSGYIKVNGITYAGPTRYTQGITLTLEAIPATAYVFSYWSGDITGSSNPANLIMSCSKTITANFASEVLTCTLGNFIWEDKNADGIQGNGEPGINGVEVNLYDSDDNFIRTTTTAEGGFYSFTDLEPGSYYLKFIYDIGGFIFSPANMGSDDQVDSDVDAKGSTSIITLANGQTDVKWDAGMYQPDNLTYSIPLSPGLNLISLPLIPVETQPEIALASLDFSVAAIYEKSEEAFKAYIKVFPPEEGFIWKDGLGYWFNMNGPGTLDFYGTELDSGSTEPLSYDLGTGWNLTGFKSTIPREPADYFASISGKCDLIYGYDEGAFFIPGGAPHELMEPGMGYWVHMLESGIIYPPLEQIIEDVTVQQAYDMIYAVAANPRLVILDVRTQTEYDGGHILNGVNLDYYSPTFTEDLNNLDKTGTYIVYCGIGGRSANALNIMNDLGFREAYNMLGGITEWIGTGFPVVN